MVADHGAQPAAVVSGTRPPMPAETLALLAGFATVTLILHFATNGRYGYWGDELYFLACGERLAWGYADHPPLIAVIARASTAWLGESLFAIRFLSALAHASLVMLTGWLAWRLGGGRFAVALAALSALLMPVYLAFTNLLTMNAFEPIFWTAAAALVVLMMAGGDRRLWLAFGLLVGLGTLNKHSMIFFTAALGVGLVLTPQRRLLRGPWPWCGALIASALIAPHVWWQIEHGWPTLELMRNARLYQYEPVTPLQFIAGQILIHHPLIAPVWLAGVAHLLLSGRARPYRALGWAYLLLVAAFMAVEAKHYYLSPAYGVLIAAGAVAIDEATLHARLAWLRPVALATITVGGLVALPYALPVLPVRALPAYLEVLGLEVPRPERREEGEVPQWFADMLGWEERVAAVARAFAKLSPEERERAAIWGEGFPEAGAIDFFGRRYRLPHAISGHQNYFLWGPRGSTGEVVITLGVGEDILSRLFERLDLAEVVECPRCMPDRRHSPVYVARGLRMPMDTLWPLLKCYTCDRPEIADRLERDSSGVAPLEGKTP
jgi:hypothetical protein